MTWGILNKQLRKKIREIPIVGFLAVKLYEFVLAVRSGPTRIRINPKKELPAFLPNSAGTNRSRNRQTISTAANFIPSLYSVCGSFLDFPRILTPSEFKELLNVEPSEEQTLSKIFMKYGSDKSSTHNYHEVYGALFPNSDLVTKVVEIGIGTNSPNVLSNMGKFHQGVGGSLRGWREYFRNAEIYGFDIDEKSLFTEDRISTAQINQLDKNSVQEAMSRFEDNSIDLFVDDGLHALDANLTPIPEVFPKLKNGGWLIVEDIESHAVPVWELLSGLPLKRVSVSRVIKTKSAYVFAMQKSNSADNQS